MQVYGGAMGIGHQEKRVRVQKGAIRIAAEDNPCLAGTQGVEEALIERMPQGQAEDNTERQHQRKRDQRPDHRAKPDAAGGRLSHPAEEPALDPVAMDERYSRLWERAKEPLCDGR